MSHKKGLSVLNNVRPSFKIYDEKGLHSFFCVYFHTKTAEHQFKYTLT